jgi:hypothetical protein
MRVVRVATAAGRTVRTVQLGDFDLLYCIPWTLASALFNLSLGAMFQLALLPSLALHRVALALNANALWLIVGAPLFIGLGVLASGSGGSYSALDAASALAVFALLLLAQSKLTAVLSEGSSGLPMSARENRARERLRDWGLHLPPGFLHEARSGRIFVLGCMATFLWLSSFAGLLLAPRGYLRLALIGSLIAFGSLFNFEEQEHLASHSPDGRLIKHWRASPALAALELLRRWIVFPACGWFLDAYYTGHTLHHHVENDGPADSQSVSRETRASFFSFCRYVVWLGVTRLIPFATALYFIDRGNRKGLRRLVFGHLAALPVLAGLFLVTPLLALAPLLIALLSGVPGFAALFRWHGLYDPTAPTSAEASTGDYSHFFHHKKPNSHLDDWLSIENRFEQTSDRAETLFFHPGIERDFWQVQALLWRKDFEGLGPHLVTLGDARRVYGTLHRYRDVKIPCPPVDPARIRAVMTSAGLEPLSRLSSLDDAVSEWMGRQTLKLAKNVTALELRPTA